MTKSKHLVENPILHEFPFHTYSYDLKCLTEDILRHSEPCGKHRFHRVGCEGVNNPSYLRQCQFDL